MGSRLYDFKLKPLDSGGGISGCRDGEIGIPAEGLSIGRDTANDVVLGVRHHPHVSSFHARLRMVAGQLWVEDLRSKNGTLVNDEPVERSIVYPGDIVQLARQVGARFLVVRGERHAETVQVPAGTDRPDRWSGAREGTATDGSMSMSRILKLRRVLGIPDDIKSFGEISRSVKRRPRFVSSVLLLFMLAGVIAFFVLRSEREERFEELRFLNESLESKLRRSNALFIEESEAWQAEKSRLELERVRLEDQISQLEVNEQSSAGEIASLRQVLHATSAKLDRFQPIDLEREKSERREKLRKVLAAIVFIEKRVVFREAGTDRYLHDSPSGPSRLRKITDRSEVFHDTIEAGSGFCISPRGWIVTNAHVIATPPLDTELVFEGVKLELVTLIDIIFSGTSRRCPATTLRVADEDKQDLAILRIEPFEGLPVIDDFDIEVGEPSAGASVRLFGFPLGRSLLQDREVLTASVFAGIVSRRVDIYLQVQAAVYPGNSGGPVVDENARVIGVVTGVQRVPGGQIASDIGFILPIADLGVIWPPDGT